MGLRHRTLRPALLAATVALLAGLLLAPQAVTAQGPHITATFVGNGQIKVTGTGFFKDPEGAEVELSFDQNGAGSGILTQFDDFDIRPNGTFTRTTKVDLTAPCLVGVSALDVPDNVFANMVDVHIPKKSCPGAHVTASLVRGTQATIVVTGTGFTPGGDVTLQPGLDDGTQLNFVDVIASGTLRPGPYPRGAGRFTATLNLLPPPCGHRVSVDAGDQETQFDVHSAFITLGC
jgi:hypothetical protein